MDTLSNAVAEVVRRELAGRQVDWADFAITVGLPKTTVWRKLKGTSKLTIDDVQAFAAGLGWTLPDLIARATAAKAEMTSAEIAEHAISGMSPEAQAAVRDFRREGATDSEGENGEPGSLAN